MSERGPFYAEGLYRVQVLDHSFETSRGGHPQITFRIEPKAVVRVSYDEGGQRIEEDDSVDQSYSRTLRLIVVDKPDNLRYALDKLRFAGFAGSKMEELDLVGETVLAECSHRTWEGRTYEQWELPLPPRKSEGFEMDSDPNVARKLNALFGKELKEGASREVRPSDGPPITDIDSANAGDFADDDIPF